jgi:hypothetical protein
MKFAVHFSGQYKTCSVIHSYRSGTYDISSVEYINFDTKSMTNSYKDTSPLHK